MLDFFEPFLSDNNDQDPPWLQDYEAFTEELTINFGPYDAVCKCVMHLLSHHAPTGAWYFVDTISNSISVIICISGMRPYRCIPR